MLSSGTEPKNAFCDGTADPIARIGLRFEAPTSQFRNSLGSLLARAYAEALYSRAIIDIGVFWDFAEFVLVDFGWYERDGCLTLRSCHYEPPQARRLRLTLLKVGEVSAVRFE